jgi:hypothetical protein
VVFEVFDAYEQYLYNTGEVVFVVFLFGSLAFSF